MAGASWRKAHLLLLLLLYAAKTATPGATASLRAWGQVKPGHSCLLPHPDHQQLQKRGLSHNAFILFGPLQRSQTARRTSSLAASFGSQAASCLGSGCRIIGMGSAVPETRITNDDLAQIVDTNDEWIRTRTGISARRVLRHGEHLRDLSLRAARDAVTSSGIQAKDIDLVLHASSSPDDLFGDGTWIGAEIQKPGDPAPPAFDITAACSGFVVGLVTANMYLTSPCSPYRRVLLVGSDALSRWVDWSDRNTCILFGDAAGAAVLAAPGAAPANYEGKPLGLLSYVLHSDGSEQRQLRLPYEGAEIPLPFKHAKGNNDANSIILLLLSRLGGRGVALDNLLYCEQDGSLVLSRGCFDRMYMNGREVFKFVSRKVPGSLESVLAAAGLKAGDVDWLLMHQANKRIIDAVAERLAIPQEKVLCNLDEYGNTSAASVPLCLSEAVHAGKVKPGDVIAMAGFGAGLTWAAAVLRYG